MNEKQNVNNYHEDERINPQELINIFLQRKNLFFYITIPVFLGIIITQFLKPYTPIYRATFDVGITKERPVEGFFSGRITETPTIQIGSFTQRVISSLLSVSLAEKVVDTLGLYTYVKKGNSDIKVEVKVKKDFRKPIGPLKLQIGNGKVKIFKNDEKFKEGFLNEFIDLELFKLKIIPLKKITDGKMYELTIYSKDRMALALRNSLSINVLEVDKIEKETGYSEISFTGEGASKKLVSATSIYPDMNLIGILRINVHWGNPDDALEIANALSEEIIREDVSEKSLQFVQSKVFIDSQLTLYQEKLNQLEDKIRSFKERKKIADLKASTQALINQISDLESKKNQLQIEEKILGNLGEYLASEGEEVRETPNFAASMLSDHVLQSFYSQLLQAEAELKGKLKEYSIGHPKVLEIQAKLDGLKEQMREETGKRTSSIKAEIGSVESQIRTLQAKLENVPIDEIQLARFERDKETAEKLYTFFAEKFEEVRVQEAGVTSDLKIINPPIVSLKPVNSRKPLLTLLLAVLISIFAGVFVVFITEYVDNTVKDPEIVTAKTGLPIFASIPIIEDDKRKTKNGKQFKEVGVLNTIKNLISHQNEKFTGSPRILNKDVSSPEFEAFRKLSMNLDFAHPEKKYRVIYVTSPGPEEGKTFVALNLGFVLATARKQVIIIDTDFRKKKGRLTDVAEFKKQEGLFNVLKDEIEPKEVITKIKIRNTNNLFYQNTQTSTPNTEAIDVDLLPVGEIPPTPFVFLESEKMKMMIKTLKEDYDYVIIDGVPVLLFADAAYLANFADGVLLTTRYGKTGFKELENSRSILVTSKSNIIGIIMNGVPYTRGSYYYRYYHKYYSKYYKKAS